MDINNQLITIIKNNNNEDLMLHLQNLMHFILNNYDKIDLNNFENISYFVKELYKNKNLKSDIEVNNSVLLRSNFYKYYKKINNICYKNKKYIEIKCQNLYKDMDCFKKCGVCLSYKEVSFVQSKMNNLYHTSLYSNIIFFGKIFGKKNYYVIELTPKTFKPNNKSDNGLNKYTYIVSSNLLDWNELPMITKEHIIASRNISYLFTGDLEAQIKGYNNNIKEKNLLKATILRIRHSNTIYPQGLYNLNDDNILEYNEEFSYNYNELKSIDNWVHGIENILLAGTITHIIDEKYSEDEKNEIINKLIESDPILEKLKPIADDLINEKQIWNIKEYGDSEKVMDNEENEISYNINLITNKLWEGFYTYISNNYFGSIYIGYGLKTNKKIINTNPGLMLNEPKIMFEQEEPNPLTPPEDKLETDSSDMEDNN